MVSLYDEITNRFMNSPTVISSKDVAKSNFKMYDAIPSPVKARPSAVDSEIEKFLPMLNDYLSCALNRYHLLTLSETSTSA
jgi:hypothetical protein